MKKMKKSLIFLIMGTLLPSAYSINDKKETKHDDEMTTFKAKICCDLSIPITLFDFKYIWLAKSPVPQPRSNMSSFFLGFNNSIRLFP